MKLLALIAVIAVLLIAAPAGAFTCTATGCTFTISYTEPTINTAGGPPQLTSTTAFYTVGTGPEKSVVTPATSATGGGVITKQITEPILPGQSVIVQGAAVATNPAGTSARATASPLTINRAGEVVDNPPTGVTVQ